MGFIPIKTIDQQIQRFIHLERQGIVEYRTALVNPVRCLLSELGIVLPLKAITIRREAHKVQKFCQASAIP